MRSSVLMFVLSVALGACGDESSPSTPDAAGGGSADAANPSACLIKGDYGAAGSISGTASMGASSLSATLEAGPPRDVFFVKLNTGKGAFAFGLTPGTYQITGADAGYTTCGLCVHIIADLVAGQGPSKFYFADSGSVTLTSTGPVNGSATNLHFNEIDSTTGAVIPGCEATMASITFATQ
jgi:hypothetical protein